MLGFRAGFEAGRLRGRSVAEPAGSRIADVSGHGFSSALLAASTSAHVRSFAETCEQVPEILRRTNAQLLRETGEGRFVTMLFVKIDRESRQRSAIRDFTGEPVPADDITIVVVKVL